MFETMVMESADAALLASVIAAAVATFGLIIVATNRSIAGKFSPYMASLAAGLLLATSVLLIEEALHLYKQAAYFVILGYVFLFALNNMFSSDNGRNNFIIPLFAIGFHSFLDGVEYGVLYNLDFRSAVMASGGLILHEFAEAVVLYIILRKANLGAFSAFVLAFIGAALTTPLGAISAVSLMDFVQPEFFGMLISVAAGALLYVGTTHLIEHIKDAKHKSLAMLFYVVGILGALVIGLLHYLEIGNAG